MLCCCAPKVDYVEWLYASMPLPDSLQYSREYWEANVAKTLEVRNSMGWNIPEREFRHFVLPLRVNNESLDDFRLVYADTLCRRVKGMSITDAALEINHWCHEQACYEPSDARTSSPCATVRRGVGRCGEESVLTVAALRAAGIPARQVYTPRWAHTDDNHAWVEVYTDGRWHFMGACEPAPTLDNAWFNGPVSRAMLLHTKVYGNYDGPEDVIQRTPCFTEINVIRNYVPSRKTVVTVMDGDSPVEGATVEFKIYNYAEFFTVASYTTGNDGTAALYTGMGDILVWARKGERFGFAKADSESTIISLGHTIGEHFSADVDISPPPENPIPSGASPEQEEVNRLRLAQEDSIRNSHPHNNPDADTFLRQYGARGQRLLSLLSAKDRGDVSLDVLEDALAVDSDLPYILSPRIGTEALRPFRKEVLASGISERLHTPAEVRQWVRDSIKIVEGRNPQELRTAPVAVWRSRIADATARDIFFVALCRTLGFSSRINPVTGKVQNFERDLWLDSSTPANIGILTLMTEKTSKAEYYRHYTLTNIRAEGSRLMEYDENAPFRPVYPLDSGYYMLTSGTRLQDGSVLVHMEFFPLPAGESTCLPLAFRHKAGALSVIGSFSMPGSLLARTGRGEFLLAVMGGAGHEPTNHAARELEACGELLKSWGRPVVVLHDVDDPAVPEEFRGEAPPIIALCDSFGKIYYISKGYNTSLAADLATVLR